VTCRGSGRNGMHMILACYTRVLPRCTRRRYMGCLLTSGFPIVIEQFWTLRNYTLFHKGLRGVWENVRILLVNPLQSSRSAFSWKISSGFLPSKKHIGHTNFGTWGLANSIPQYLRLIDESVVEVHKSKVFRDILELCVRRWKKPDSPGFSVKFQAIDIMAVILWMVWRFLQKTVDLSVS
jgi:hypothetical protein